MIKTVLIDLDDTLWATQANNRESLEELYKLHQWSRGYSSFDELYSLYSPYNEYLWSEYREGRITKHELTIRRFSHFLQKIDAYSEDEILAINDQFMERTALKKKLVDGAIELLEYLNSLYQVVIVSNGFVEVQHRKMLSAGITPYVDHVVLSEHVGVSKPNNEIFNYALNKSKARKSETIFIGDSWSADIIGAQNVGLSSIWYNPAKALPPKPINSYRYPIYQVCRLIDIIPLMRSFL